MKILFYSDALVIDGVTSYILNVGKVLKDAGHEVAIIGRWGGVKGFQSRYKEAGMKLITCPSISVGNFYFDICAKRFKPDIIMTDPRRSFPLATRLKKLTGTKVVTYFLDPVEKTDKPGRDIESLKKYSEVWTAFEEPILKELHEIAPKFKIFELTRPVDAFIKFESLGENENFNILCFGRLSRGKTPGIFCMLDHIEEIINKIPNVKINIVGGSGWRLFKIKLLAHKINSRLGHEYIKIFGTQVNPIKFLREANLICCVASSAMESAYMGRPVIMVGSHYRGLLTPENFDDAIKGFFGERSGVLFEYKNLLPEIFKVYENYRDEKFRDDLKNISVEINKKFSAGVMLRQFNKIIGSL